jgi:hypothetical protein
MDLREEGRGCGLDSGGSDTVQWLFLGNILMNVGVHRKAGIFFIHLGSCYYLKSEVNYNLI